MILIYPCFKVLVNVILTKMLKVIKFQQMHNLNHFSIANLPHENIVPLKFFLFINFG